MPHFTDLPVASGWGDWHLNRFRVVFRSPPGAPPTTAANLAAQFISKFPAYVWSKAATVQQFRQGSDNLYKFHGAVPIVGMKLQHYDWVRVITTLADGFTVQTLHRDTPDADDGQVGAIGSAVGAGAGGMLGLTMGPAAAVAEAYLGGQIGGATATLINRFHILAGRRSWLLRPANKLDGVHDPRPPLPATDFVLETAAIERMSILPFVAGAPVIEGALPAVWQNLLANFVSGNGMQHVPYPPEPGWQITTVGKTDIHWYRQSFGYQTQLLGSAYAQDVQRVFPLILDLSQRPTHELQAWIDAATAIGRLAIS